MLSNNCKNLVSSQHLQDSRDGLFTVMDLIDTIAESYPNKRALIFGNQEMSYKDLKTQSDQFALRLTRSKIRRGDVVALSLDKSIDFIISILGILKAGAVYLPLDPHYPQERIKCVLRDAQPSLVITKDKFAYPFSDFTSITTILDSSTALETDFDLQQIPKQKWNFIDQNSPPAYIIYTSGTSGNPKGVVIKHSSLLNVIESRRDYYPNSIKTILLGSISFDMSLMIIFQALTYGGTLLLPKEEFPFNVDRILSSIQSHELDFLLCTPSLYDTLLRKNLFLPSLQYVVLVGECVVQSLINYHIHMHPHANLFNEYGPTEYTICATVAKIYCAVTGKLHKSTIGKAIRNTIVCILDENRHEVTTGEKGEIYIAGKGTAHGYLHQKELTQEKFIPRDLCNLHSDIGNYPILYKTGDIGIVLADGHIEYLGRMDTQIKIRGYRIELTEIENVIANFPGIERAIAVVYKQRHVNQLRVYFTSVNEVSVEELKKYIRTRLPDYMVPAEMSRVNQFPLTTHGKVDRTKFIPQPVETFSRDELSTFSTTREEELLLIWREVLEKDIGIHDSFFESGGDSLLVFVLQSVIKERLGIEPSVSMLFQYVTVKQLADYLDNTVVAHRNIGLKDSAAQRKQALTRLRQQKIDYE